MKIGINFETNRVFIENDTNGVITQQEMSTRVARAVAEQLLSSADTLDNANEHGLLDDDVS